MTRPEEAENRDIDVNRDYNEIRVGDRASYAGRDYYDMRGQHREVPVQRDDVEGRLLKAVGSEVESRLEQSLHNKVYITLDKQQDPAQVQRPWDVELKTGKGDRLQLPTGTKIETIFDRRDINGRLLILGAPGSGKTTTLLELVKVLAARAEQNPKHPVPILLNLSSWKDDKQGIADWMAAALKLRYGLRVDIGKQFITKHRVLPLLDGLDELASDRQLGCVDKINEFLREWMGGLVVCSRIEEYQHYEALLGLQNSIILQPLRIEQIRDYVQSESLRLSIEGDSNLLELAEIPLMLNVMVVVSVKWDFQRWQQLAFSEARLDYLFGAYIDTVLGEPRKKDPKREQTYRWLGWLAVQLIRDNQTEFLIEKMQPNWLASQVQRLIYSLIYGSINGLIAGPISGLILGTIGWIIIMLIMLAGRRSEDPLFDEKIKTAETLKWDWKKAKREFTDWLVFVPIIGVFGLLGVLTEGLAKGLIIGLIIGLIVGLIARPIVVLTGGFVGKEIESKTIPNQGIRQSCINIIPLSAIAFLPIFGLMFTLLTVLGQVIIGYVFIIFFYSIGLALLFGIFQGRAFIQHFALRLVLCWKGYAPWNYAKFLNYATDRLLMQRVGGGYRFLHDLLRQHFAKHYKSSSERSRFRLGRT